MKNTIFATVLLILIILIVCVVFSFLEPALKTNEITVLVDGTFEPVIYKSDKMFIIQNSNDTLDYCFIIIPKDRNISIPSGTPVKVFFGLAFIPRDLNVGVSIDDDFKIQSYHTLPVWTNRKVSFVYGKNHFLIKFKKSI